jgi:DNA (cytosine-5)-methyltransferase 1
MHSAWSSRGRPKLLDLFCGAGGASRGYIDAGFDVMGIDHVPQPYYPRDSMGCIVADFRCFEPAWIAEQFTVVHASPPCQAFSPVRNMTGKQYDDLITETRNLCQATGLPYVIENVPWAPLENAFQLCGDCVGLPIVRHRIFESNIRIVPPPCYGHTAARSHLSFLDTKESAYRDAMECDWMSVEASRQAIPPRYTRWIGERLLKVIHDGKNLAEGEVHVTEGDE